MRGPNGHMYQQLISFFFNEVPALVAGKKEIVCCVGAVPNGNVQASTCGRFNVVDMGRQARYTCSNVQCLASLYRADHVPFNAKWEVVQHIMKIHALRPKVSATKR